MALHVDLDEGDRFPLQMLLDICVHRGGRNGDRSLPRGIRELVVSMMGGIDLQQLGPAAI